MKNKSGKRLKSAGKWEQRAIFLMVLGVGAAAAFCILLIISITVDRGNFAATLETFSLYNREAIGLEFAPQEKTQPQAGTSIEYSSDPEVIQLPILSMATEGAAASEEEMPPAQTSQPRQEISRYIFLGDSRYVAMAPFAQEQDYFIAKEGMGYAYLLQQLDSVRAAAIPGSVLIIGLGVNDLKAGNASSYIQTINELGRTLNARVCYMLVNPVDEAVELQNGYRVTNAEIDAFNEAMKAGLEASVQIIDTNSFLKNDGYVTTDGLHYNMDTYQKIYQYIKAQIWME